MDNRSVYWCAVGQIDQVLAECFESEDARDKALSEIVTQYSPFLCKEDAAKLNNVIRSTYRRFRWKRHRSVHR